MKIFKSFILASIIILGLPSQSLANSETCKTEIQKSCGMELNSPHDQKQAQELYNCIVVHWKEFREECQAQVRSAIPMFGAIEEDINTQEWVDITRNKPKKVKITDTKHTVNAYLQQNDEAWYKAKIIKKKVVEQYPFCPKMEDKGLRLMVNYNSNTCYYDVLNKTKQRIINELREQHLLQRIDYSGVRDFPSSQDKSVVTVLDKYSSRCPEGFFIDFFNHQNTNNQEILCVSKNRQDCDTSQGWVRSYPKDGLLGCRKMAPCNMLGEHCQEFTNNKYCAECYAGGCVDTNLSQNYDDDPVMFCKVNIKNPEMTKCEDKQ